MIETEQIYQTVFINKRKAPVRILEQGLVFCVLPPGREFEVEAFSPLTSYARFSQVTYLEGDKVDIKINSDWKMPAAWKDLYIVEALNTDGKEIETIYPTTAADPGVQCYRGIPRLIAVGVGSPFVRFKRIELKYVKEKRRNPENPDYLIWTTSLQMVREERGKNELKKIEAEIKVITEKWGDKQAYLAPRSINPKET
jgi:hypothetical protein